MATSPEPEICEELLTWWAAAPEGVSRDVAALPSALGAHVRECLDCYRLTLSWRELPRHEDALRALLRDDAAATGAAGSTAVRGSGLDHGPDAGLDDAFWRDLPSRVYAEVEGSRAAERVRQRWSLRRPRSLLMVAFGGAAAAALVFGALPRLTSPRGAPATPGVALDEGRASADVQRRGLREGSSPAAALPLDWATGVEDTTFVGALADLGPQELEALLGDVDGAFSSEVDLDDLDGAELGDLWERQPARTASEPTR